MASEKRVTLSVRIQPGLKQWLEEQARDQHRSVGQTLELILEQEFAAPQMTASEVIALSRLQDDNAVLMPNRLKRWFGGA